jgi:hypothetical protein
VAEQDRGSDDPQLAAIARHALHDEELIAAYAAGDVADAADAERARSLVERCATCREIHGDLVAIRSVTQASGTAAQRAAARGAPRDFRLTADDAARLQPGSPVARLAARLGWRARLGRSVAAFGRPVGAALATFGVVGLLVGSFALGGGPLALTGGAAGAPSEPMSAPGVDQSGATPEATVYRASYGPLATRKEGGSGNGPEAAGSGGGSGTTVLLGGSVVLVIVGLGLILAARRRPGSVSAQRGN